MNFPMISLAFSLFCLTLGANQNAPDFDCDTLDTIALKSAEFCAHDVKDGFTWEEMRACEKKVENACKGRENCPGFKLPNEADFKRIDRKGNNDGRLELFEWEDYYGCEPEK